MSKYSHKLMGKEVGPASTYAEPHTMDGKKIEMQPAGRTIPLQKKQDWKPLDGVSLSMNNEVKTSGVKARGTGAAIKGTMSRGPMA